MDKKIADNIYILVCDDVRHEVGNKVSIMGIYDDIVLRETPAILPKINLAILLKGFKRNISKVQVKLKCPDGNDIDMPEMTIPPNKKTGSNYNLDICVAPLKVIEPGKFVWEIRFDGEKKPTIKHEMDILTVNMKK